MVYLPHERDTWFYPGQEAIVTLNMVGRDEPQIRIRIFPHDNYKVSVIGRTLERDRRNGGIQISSTEFAANELIYLVDGLGINDDVANPRQALSPNLLIILRSHKMFPGIFFLIDRSETGILNPNRSAKRIFDGPHH